ncbi:hypothetical protein [Mycobacterium branderi]|uniref:Low molecular weight antigen MTB12 n=1 Tax=Mycobacterium branderi TaxID=43348 RepID=A0A7I7WBL6_9MYCO|nr:hypothetical protein [Mycobacterium branderi]MCV7234414.1 hypothetical protein [Mycobacterium branderi]ORA38465.1 hypothetical protein BST20_11795 [Mycobacterium branderi]BBZ13258.1 low molecular weight antigen MTB12 [Mycobacterium branderi]
MTLKALATGVAAVAAIGAAAAGLTSSYPTTSQVQPVVFSVPLPLDQTTALPTVGQLSTVLTSLADPNVPFANKSGLVEGGISPSEAALADHALQKAAKKGQLPLTFGISNIQAAAPGSATADVAVSGPKLTAPVTQSVTFVNQGSWVLSRDSAMTLLHAASGH